MLNSTPLHDTHSDTISTVDPALFKQQSVKDDPDSDHTIPFSGIRSLHSPFSMLNQPLQPFVGPEYTYGPPLQTHDWFETGHNDDYSSYAVSGFVPWEAGLCAIDKQPMPASDQCSDTTVKDALRLKGVLWPGMDLFDSAPDDMRRKRNQKKSESIVDKLAILSRQVEAIEHKHDKQGILMRTREITGFPYSDSEGDADAPTPPRRRRTITSRKAWAGQERAPKRSSRKASKRGQSPPHHGTDVTTIISADTAPRGKSTRKRARKSRTRRPLTEGTDLAIDLPAANDIVDSIEVEVPQDCQHSHVDPLQLFHTTPSWLGLDDFSDDNASGNVLDVESSLLAGWDLFTRTYSAPTTNPLYMPSAIEDSYDEAEAVGIL